MERWVNLAEKLRISYWFVPLTLALVGMALAWLALRADVALQPPTTPGGWAAYLYHGKPVEARDTLTMLFGTMTGMTSLVFTITLIVLTLVSGQFGPRMIRSFIGSPLSQVVLGTFILTSVYTLLTRAVVGAGPDEALPYPSVSLGIGLALVCLVLLIFYLHALATSIVAETVIEQIGQELDGLVAKLPMLPKPQPEPVKTALPPDDDLPERRLGLGRGGYVQTLGYERLAAEAMRAGATIRLTFQPGDFVVADDKVLSITPAEAVTPRLEQALRDTIRLGAHRTPKQDLTFCIRQLADMAVRALSPGVNDAYTASAVVNRLSQSLCRLLERQLPGGRYGQAEGRWHLQGPAPTFGQALSVAFDQIRQLGCDKPLLVKHLLSALKRLAQHAQLPDQKEAIATHLQAVEDAARHAAWLPYDQAQLEAQLADAKEEIKVEN